MEHPKDDYILLFSTLEAYVFKSLTDFLHNILTCVIFKVTNTGIKCIMDNAKDPIPESLLIDLNLKADMFYNWIIPESLEEDDDAELLIIADASNLHKACSNIYKKDSITMHITKDEPYKLVINIKNTEKGRDLTNCVTLLTKDNKDVIPKFNHVEPCIFTLKRPTAVGVAIEFQKACKAGSQIKATTVHIEAKKTGVRVKSENGEVSKMFTFGTWNDKEDTTYDQRFQIREVVAPLAKCCSMTKQVRFYCEGEKPLRVTFDTGDFGTLDVYLVPNKTTK